MALLGGGVGGAGNPVGGSFTGPAEALEIVGDFAYGYSGLQQINTTPVQHLLFTSGNFLFVGEVTFQGAEYDQNVEAGTQSICILKLNDVTVLSVKIDTVREAQMNPSVFPFIIPSYTEVDIAVASQHTTTDYFTAVTLTGRIYRTRE